MRSALDLLTTVPEILALAPNALPRYVAQLQMLSRAGRDAFSAAAKSTRATPAPRTTAVVEIGGVILPKSNWVSDLLGWATAAGIKSAIDTAAADDSIDEIFLLIDSPGGDVIGVQECADSIFAARNEKPVIAYIDGLGCSAAYWLASQSTRVTMLGSGEAGSIGVISAHVDLSRANEQDGISVTTMTSSKYKGELSSDSPLSAEARDFQMSRLLDYHRAFVAAVARGRGTTTTKVENDFGQGRSLGSAQAVKVGMVDGIKSSALEALTGRGARSAASARRVVRDGERDTLIAAYRDPVFAAQLRARGWEPLA